MRNFKLIASLLLILVCSRAYPQKIGVVDTDYILSKLPQYQEAESRMKDQVAAWQEELSAMQADYDKKKATFDNERVLLVGDQLKAREKELADLDKKIKTTLAARFGAKGEINNTRSNLAKPYQDQIWNAIKTVSEKNSLGIVLDKSNNISVIFLDKKYDYTDKVLDLLLKNNSGDQRGRKSDAPSDGQHQRLPFGRATKATR